MKIHEDDRAATIKGTITLPDGTTSEFHLYKDGGWSQWGASNERLSRSGAILDAMKDGLLDADMIVSDSDEDYDDDDEGQVRGCSCGMADYGAPGHDGDGDDAPDVRVVASVGDPGKWQAQYRDTDMDTWFDIGDAQTDKAEAERRAEEHA